VAPVRTSGDQALLEFELPGRAEAPSAARKALSSLNGSLHLVSDERLRDVQLAVTEVIANAVRHATPEEGAVKLIVRANEEIVRVEVTDQGAGFDPATVPRPSTDRGGGWGLEIVAAIARQWGVEHDGATTVWFEIEPR
jgi:anti-sigma regulatory factor (Ser/Thr protein kinase)